MEMKKCVSAPLKVDFQSKNMISGSEIWKILKLQKMKLKVPKEPHFKFMSILSFLEISRFLSNLQYLRSITYSEKSSKN